ncbi:hypothetical protein RA307_21310 [Xanthobacteraceae bacterium Astr-EGSB]|uniref:hypothetical protein n=1 Tax=Astrobacterium formosum TaxID=3069710 RepID=UPI0027B6B2EF|nr:hypothetical protein [Xanthobacteraceae bacterium Astr-EGSB]
MSRRFMPSPVQIHWLIAVGFSSVGYGMYLRYLGIENSVVGLACDAGLDTWMCLTRRIALPIYEHYAIGGAAVAAALVQLLRPTFPVLAVALALTGLGLVLFNAALSGLAAGLLVLSFARPAAATA